MERIDNYAQYKEISNRLNERNDCCVVTFATVFNTDYMTAWKTMKEKFHRKKRRGTFMARYPLKETLPEYKIADGPYSKENKISLAQFCKKHPNGRFFVLVRGHALAVIDGVVYDHSDKPRRMVDKAWRVYLEDK